MEGYKRCLVPARPRDPVRSGPSRWGRPPPHVGDADPGLRAAIDRAYRAKYGRYGDAYVGPMTGAAAAATLRLDPR
ncbi:DUF2255 family protein [Actinotalea lenta]|uniref:DUF2255 family protein n=1 Tax=Actinotalea lenta TaxID=3064654 RepID=UPI003312FA42